jgi:uncharacterized protein YwgA
MASKIMGDMTKNQPVYKRQRFLLEFLSRVNEDISSTELQKLVFLHAVVADSNYYEFVPYKYGPYSFRLKEDLDILARDGFVAIERSKTAVRARVVNAVSSESSFNIASERGDDLIRKVYRLDPYYTKNSEIIERLFSGAEKENFTRAKSSHKTSEQVLYTIGYEGRSIEGFANVLIRNEVAVLCDIRRNPISRKFMFSKTQLEHVLKEVGIIYLHFPELGIESAKRRLIKEEAGYEALFEEYANRLSHSDLSVRQIADLLYKNHKIAIMCFESTAQACHRHVLSDRIVESCGVKTIDL